MELKPLIDRFRGPLTGLFASWGVPWHDAHELAQDTFVEAYLGRDSFRGDAQQIEKLGRWLRGIARNLFRLWSRNRRRRVAESIDGQDIAAPRSAPGNPELDPLRSAIDQLPRKLRDVVYMHYLEESSVAVVAGLLKVSQRSVEGRLYRARAILRDRLRPHAPMPPSTKEVSQ